MVAWRGETSLKALKIRRFRSDIFSVFRSGVDRVGEMAS
jgi:hypothetical protein